MSSRPHRPDHSLKSPLFSSRRGLQPNEERVSELLAMVLPKLDAYEVILAKQLYLAGDVSYIEWV